MHTHTHTRTVSMKCIATAVALLVRPLPRALSENPIRMRTWVNGLDVLVPSQQLRLSSFLRAELSGRTHLAKISQCHVNHCNAIIIIITLLIIEVLPRNAIRSRQANLSSY